MAKRIKSIENEAKMFPIDRVCDLIKEGQTLINIANAVGYAYSTFIDAISNTDNSARVREAREASADAFADKAEQALLDLPGNATAAQICQARELAHHWRWKAAKRKPKEYSDKIDHTTDGEKIAMPAPVITVLSTGVPFAASENEIKE